MYSFSYLYVVYLTSLSIDQIVTAPIQAQWLSSSSPRKMS
jgi:hypothetical protein